MTESYFEIEGGHPLQGELTLSGAKNAALPLIVAACLGDEPTILENVPTGLNDVRILVTLLQAMGAAVEVNGTVVSCARGDLRSGTAPGDLANQIRYSLLLLGLYGALHQELYLPVPGGCQIGDRKFDLHLMGLRELGVIIDEQPDGIRLIPDKLVGNRIDFYLPTTTGTENIMIAAAAADGTTVIRNANTRLEVENLGRLLSAMGARVRVSNRIVEIEGSKRLRGGARVSVIPGWDEAITYIVAAGMTRGEIAIRNFGLEGIREDARYLREAGIELFEWQGSLYMSGRNAEKKPFELFTAPYPGVNSDMQPIFAALAISIPGTSVITDLRFTERFKYVDELRRFGSDIQAFGNTAIVVGGTPLTGTDVAASDLRGGAACVLCGLIAEGQTRVHNIYQIERGYEHIVDKLAGLGASIRRVPATQG